jgi:hypothetical protein
MTIEDIIARDIELTNFKHFVLENQDNPITDKLIGSFEFQHIDPVKNRELLMRLAHETLRYPHRVPPKK